jgi:hypothetical protein
MDILMIAQYAYYELRKKYLARPGKELDIIAEPAPETSDNLIVTTTQLSAVLVLGLFVTASFYFSEDTQQHVHIGRKLLQTVCYA